MLRCRSGALFTVRIWLAIQLLGASATGDSGSESTVFDLPASCTCYSGSQASLCGSVAADIVTSAEEQWGSRCLKAGLSSSLYCFAAVHCGVYENLNCSWIPSMPANDCLDTGSTTAELEDWTKQTLRGACNTAYDYHRYDRIVNAGLEEDGEPLVIRVGMTVSQTGDFDGIVSRPFTYLTRALGMAYFVGGLGLAEHNATESTIRFEFCVEDDESDIAKVEQFYTKWSCSNCSTRMDFVMSPIVPELIEKAVQVFQDSEEWNLPVFMLWPFHSLSYYEYGIGEQRPPSAQLVRFYAEEETYNGSSTDDSDTFPDAPFLAETIQVTGGGPPTIFMQNVPFSEYAYDAVRYVQLKSWLTSATGSALGEMSATVVMAVEESRITPARVAANRAFCFRTVDMIRNMGIEANFADSDTLYLYQWFGLNSTGVQIVVFCGFDVTVTAASQMLSSLAYEPDAVIMASPQLQNINGKVEAPAFNYWMEALPWPSTEWIYETTFPYWGHMQTLLRDVMGALCFESTEADRKCQPWLLLQVMSVSTLMLDAVKWTTDPTVSENIKRTLVSRPFCTPQGIVQFNRRGDRRPPRNDNSEAWAEAVAACNAVDTIQLASQYVAQIPLEVVERLDGSLRARTYSSSRVARDPELPADSTDLNVRLQRSRTFHLMPLEDYPESFSTYTADGFRELDNLANYSGFLWAENRETTALSFQRCGRGCTDSINDTDVAACSPCQPGTSKSEDELWCRPCKAGRYSDAYAAEECKACEEGSDCHGSDREIGRKYPPDSAPSYYRVLAPARHRQSSAFLGWFRGHVSPGPSPARLCEVPYSPLLVEYMRCPRTEDCIGRNICVDHSAATACRICERGYMRSIAGICVECFTPPILLVFILFILLVLAVVVWRLSNSVLNAADDMASTTVPLLRILVHHLQAMAVMRDTLSGLRGRSLAAYDVPAILGYTLTAPWKLVGLQCLWEDIHGHVLWANLLTSLGTTLSGYMIIFLLERFTRWRKQLHFARYSKTLLRQQIQVTDGVMMSKNKILKQYRKSIKGKKGETKELNDRIKSPVRVPRVLKGAMKQAKKKAREIKDEKLRRGHAQKSQDEVDQQAKALEKKIKEHALREVSAQKHRVWTFATFLEHSRWTMWRRCTIWMLLSYSATLSGVLDSVACVYVAGTHRLLVNLDIECGEDEHRSLGIVAMVITVLLAGFMPLLIGVFMKRQQHRFTSIAFRVKFGCMFLGYKQSRNWFEMVYLYRLSLLACTKFLPPAQRALPQLVIILGNFAVMHALQPYLILDCKVLVWVSRLSEGLLVITYVCNVGMTTLEKITDSQATASVLDEFIRLVTLQGRDWVNDDSRLVDIYSAITTWVNTAFMLIVFIMWIQNRFVLWAWIMNSLQMELGPVGKLLLALRKISRGRHNLKLIPPEVKTEVAAYWIEAITGTIVISNHDKDGPPLQSQFVEALGSGELLIQLMAKVADDRVELKLKKDNPSPRDKITAFLKACSQLGLSKDHLFDVDDLLRGQAVVKVVSCIYRLGRHMEHHLRHEVKLDMAIWWLEEILDEQLHEPHDEEYSMLLSKLRSGEVLCKLINIIVPEAIPVVLHNTPDLEDESEVDQERNFDFFQKACLDFGVTQDHLIFRKDVVQGHLVNIAEGIHALGVAVQMSMPSLEIPTLGIPHLSKADSDGVDGIDVTAMSRRARHFLMESIQESLLAQMQASRVPMKLFRYMMVRGMVRSVQLREERRMAAAFPGAGNARVTRGAQAKYKHSPLGVYERERRCRTCITKCLLRWTRYLHGKMNDGDTTLDASQDLPVHELPTHNDIAVEELYIGLQATTDETNHRQGHGLTSYMTDAMEKDAALVNQLMDEGHTPPGASGTAVDGMMEATRPTHRTSKHSHLFPGQISESRRTRSGASSRLSRVSQRGSDSEPDMIQSAELESSKFLTAYRTEVVRRVMCKDKIFWCEQYADALQEKLFQAELARCANDDTYTIRRSYKRFHPTGNASYDQKQNGDSTYVSLEERLHREEQMRAMRALASTFDVDEVHAEFLNIDEEEIEQISGLINHRHVEQRQALPAPPTETQERESTLSEEPPSIDRGAPVAANGVLPPMPRTPASSNGALTPAMTKEASVRFQLPEGDPGGETNGHDVASSSLERPSEQQAAGTPNGAANAYHTPSASSGTPAVVETGWPKGDTRAADASSASPAGATNGDATSNVPGVKVGVTNGHETKGTNGTHTLKKKTNVLF